MGRTGCGFRSAPRSAAATAAFSRRIARASFTQGGKIPSHLEHVIKHYNDAILPYSSSVDHDGSIVPNPSYGDERTPHLPA
jgi:hypothetical protein